MQNTTLCAVNASMAARANAIAASGGFNLNQIPILAKAPNVTCLNPPLTINQQLQIKANWLSGKYINGVSFVGQTVYIAGAISSTQNAYGKMAFCVQTINAHRSYFARVQKALAKVGINSVNPACPKQFRAALAGNNPAFKNFKPRLNCSNAFFAINTLTNGLAMQNLHATNKWHSQNSFAVLVIMPRKSFKSTGVQQELLWAVAANVPIITF